MRTTLEARQIERYRERGCLRLDGFLSADELAELTDAVTGGVQELAGREAEPMELAPGSAAVFNGMLVHGAGPNMTPGWRRAMTCAYMPDGTTYNGERNILTDEQVARLQVGSPLDDESQNPVAWSRTRAPTFA